LTGRCTFTPRADFSYIFFHGKSFSAEFSAEFSPEKIYEKSAPSKIIEGFAEVTKYASRHVEQKGNYHAGLLEYAECRGRFLATRACP
jgi:hypothetical protein